MVYRFGNLYVQKSYKGQRPHTKERVQKVRERERESKKGKGREMSMHCLNFVEPFLLCSHSLYLTLGDSFQDNGYWVMESVRDVIGADIVMYRLSAILDKAGIKSWARCTRVQGADQIYYALQVYMYFSFVIKV